MPRPASYSGTTSRLAPLQPETVRESRVKAPIFRWFWPFVAGCLVLQAVLAVDCARQWTPTHDEYWHLPIGLRIWKSGRFDDDVINPPPVRLWAAIPLALGGANPGDVDSRLDVGEIGDAFWKANGERARFWFLLGRLMIIPFATLTGLAIVVWARSWYGQRAAMVSVLMWTCCPTALANAAIVTHDLPLAAAWTLTLLALVRFAERPSWMHASLFGLALGVAPLSKLTGLLLGPLCIVLWFVLRVRVGGRPEGEHPTSPAEVVHGLLPQNGPFPQHGPLPEPGAKALEPPGQARWLGNSLRGRSRIVLMWLAAMLVSLAVINAGYLFRGTGTSLGSLVLASPKLQVLQQSAPWLAGLPVPLPRDFIAALDRLAQDLEARHPVYLDGEWSTRPFVRYYAAALCYKLPISTLVLVLLGLAGIVWPRRLCTKRGSDPRPHEDNTNSSHIGKGSDPVFVQSWPRAESHDRRHGLFLLIAASILPVLASGSSNQIGIRYVLPTLPLLCVIAGQAARWLEFEKSPASRVWITRLVWMALLAAPLSLRFHPHHLAYFNALAGGPVGGRSHLVDSNIDWGQDLHALKTYLDQHQIQDVGLAYFGTVVPASIGIQAHQPQSGFPVPGWYAISVNFVQGRPHALRDSNGDRTNVGIEEFGYFRFFEPVATIGYSINIYRLSQQDVGRYAAALQQMQRETR